jgi:hypothetical protein
MIPSIAELISPELAGASGRIFGDDNEFVRVYIHDENGDTYIGGGSVGPQWITTMAIDDERYIWILNVFQKLDEQLDLDFVESSTPNGSQINIYFDTEIEVGGSGTTLGLALSNEGRRRSWWEIVINAPALAKDQDYLDFAIVHELGHVMGLEHPFDSSDGDVAGERFGDPDASETTMSYTRPVEGWPDFYSDADLTAMAAIWGLEDDRGEEWLISDRYKNPLLLTADAANERLREEISGDLVIGQAPGKPPEPILALDQDGTHLQINQLVNAGEWQYRWGNETEWTTQSNPIDPDASLLELQSNGQDILLLTSETVQALEVRQTDRWDRPSDSVIRYAGIASLSATPPETTADSIPDEDTITNWQSDFNSDGKTSIGLEGKILLRHLCGTFPGSALSHNIQGLASENHMLVGNDTSSRQLETWLEQGKAVGGFGGNVSEALNALGEGLSFIESL